MLVVPLSAAQTVSFFFIESDALKLKRDRFILMLDHMNCGCNRICFNSY